MPYHKRDGNLIVDFTAMPDTVPSGSVGGSRRGESSESRRGKKKQNVTLEDSSSSNLAQSFSDFSLDETSQSSQGYNPVHPAYYPHAYFTHDQYATGQAPPHFPSTTDYQDQQSSGGFFDYVFGQGATQGYNQEDSGGYDFPRHSTMWNIISPKFGS
ncbi:hypothetical protein RIF29_23953 [Crotalaria pallida]|uniref:Uncharacterized protein n=1 Tax=Crotalaria pallida TaxID=3830 RepID=A0AAN9EJN2_CROPI